MAQPKEPPVSIRPGNERLARIDAYAKEHALSRHLAIMVLIDDALGRAGQPAKVSVPAKTLPGGGYLAPSGGAPSKPPTGGSAVQFGPTPSAPGSRLNKGKPK